MRKAKSFSFFDVSRIYICLLTEILAWSNRMVKKIDMMMHTRSIWWQWYKDFQKWICNWLSFINRHFSFFLNLSILPPLFTYCHVFLFIHRNNLARNLHISCHKTKFIVTTFSLYFWRHMCCLTFHFSLYAHNTLSILSIPPFSPILQLFERLIYSCNNA